MVQGQHSPLYRWRLPEYGDQSTLFTTSRPISTLQNIWTNQHSSEHMDQSALFRTFGPISTLQNILTSTLQNIWTNHPSSEHMDQYSSEHLDQSSLYGTSEALTTLQNILYGQIITLQKIRTNQHSTECMEQRASFSRYSRSVRFSRHTSIRIFEKNRRGVGGGGWGDRRT